MDDRSKNWFAKNQKLYKKASKLFINNFYQFIYKKPKILTIVQNFGSAENVKFVKRGFRSGGFAGGESGCFYEAAAGELADEFFHFEREQGGGDGVAWEGAALDDGVDVGFVVADG